MKNKRILKRPFSSSLSHENFNKKIQNFKTNFPKKNLRIFSACLSSNDIIPNSDNLRIKSSKSKYNYTTNFSSSKFRSKIKIRPQTAFYTSTSKISNINLFSRTKNENLDFLNLIIDTNPYQFNRDMIQKKMQQINHMYIIGSESNYKRPKFDYTTEELFYNYNLLYANKTHNLIKTYSPKMHPLSSSVKTFLKKMNYNLKENEPLFNEEEILLFCKSKCKDIGIEFRDNILNKFKDYCSLRCKNRIADLSDSFYGINSVYFLIPILSQSDRISRLNLSKNNLGDKGVELLVNAVKNSKSLVSLDISSNSISYKGGEIIFKNFIEQQSIINLNVSSYEGINRNRLTANGIKYIIKYLKKNYFVEKLNLARNSLKNEGFELVAKGINNNINLNELNIGNNDIDEEGIKQSLTLINKCKIISLNLSGNKIKDEGLILLANNLRHFPELKIINVSNCGIGYKGFKELLNVLQSVRRIESLDISENRLFSTKFEELKVYFCAFGLRYLNLSKCQLEDDTSYLLGECLSLNETIKVLNLSHNKISDSGFRSFVYLLKTNSTLETFDLSSNYLSDKSIIEFLSNAEYNTTLKYLNLYDNRIRNEVGKYIIKCLETNKSLLKINLFFNRVQLKTIEEINKKLKLNNIKEKNKKVPDIKRTLKELEFNPNEFKFLTKNIKTKKDQKITITKKIKEEQKNYEILLKEENKKINLKKKELEKIEEKLKILDDKIGNFGLNMKLLEEDLVLNENKIKKQIQNENKAKSEIEILNIKAKADYELAKKDIENEINKTRVKYGESQDRIINAQKTLSKYNLNLKKLNKQYESLMNSNKKSIINIKETQRGKSFARRKSQFNRQSLHELDINKINANINPHDKEKNTLTISTSPTINDVNKKIINKKRQLKTINK